MKILITGASGFVGSNLINLLQNQNHQITVLTRDQKKIKKFKWSKKIKIYEKDLFTMTDKNYKELASNDIVVHLAWDGLPNYNSEIHYKNYKQSFKFIKSLIDNKVKHFLITGTCFEYGIQNGCLTENCKTMPSNTYGISKNNLRIDLFDYIQGKNVNIQWARLFYIYGNRQSEKSLFGQLDKSLQNKENYFFMSKGDQVRDYLKIEDACKRIYKLIMNSYINGIINICSNRPVSIENLVLKYLKQKASKIKLIKGHYDYNDYEPMYFWGHSNYFDKFGNLKKNERNNL